MLPNRDCFDMEGNDKIDFREFLLLVQNYERPLSEEQEIREMFNAIDTDRNGFIDVDELKSTFSKLGVPLSNSDIRDMLKEANVHGTRIFYEGDRTRRLFVRSFYLIHAPCGSRGCKVVAKCLSN